MPEDKVIVPTVGRKVYFRPPANDVAHGFHVYNKDQPCDATVVYVHSERMVNVLIVDHMGNQHKRTSVPFNQPGDDASQHQSGYVEWMPFQVGQAKVNALELGAAGRAAGSTTY
ncbi:MAG: hypothetical protein V4614_14985 [Pseudomonadota bacterium]